jgi:hypothetical protein
MEKNEYSNFIRLSSSLYQTQIDFTRSAHEAKGSSFTPTLQGSEAYQICSQYGTGQTN